MECLWLIVLPQKTGSEREQIIPLLDSVKLKTLSNLYAWTVCVVAPSKNGCRIDGEIGKLPMRSLSRIKAVI